MYSVLLGMVPSLTNGSEFEAGSVERFTKEKELARTFLLSRVANCNEENLKGQYVFHSPLCFIHNKF